MSTTAQADNEASSGAAMIYSQPTLEIERELTTPVRGHLERVVSRSPEFLNIQARTRFGDMVHIRGTYPACRVPGILKVFNDSITLFDAERPIVPYNPGFAAWQQGKLGCG